MKSIHLAALVATFAIAVTALVFAVWPAVADAPWEDDTPVAVVVEGSGVEARCEEAVSNRRSLVEASLAPPDTPFDISVPGSGGGATNYEELIEQADVEIEAFCR